MSRKASRVRREQRARRPKASSRLALLPPSVTPPLLFTGLPAGFSLFPSVEHTFGAPVPAAASIGEGRVSRCFPTRPPSLSSVASHDPTTVLTLRSEERLLSSFGSFIGWTPCYGACTRDCLARTQVEDGPAANQGRRESGSHHPPKAQVAFC